MSDRIVFHAIFATFCVFLGACGQTQKNIDSLDVASPDGSLVVRFLLEDGKPRYAVDYKGRAIIDTSRLGFSLQAARALHSGFVLAAADYSSVDEQWTQPWGEVETIRNHYNELRVSLRELGNDGRLMNIVFRVYDDGLGFRYEWPQQAHLKDFVITDEHTEFALAGDFKAWWVPAYEKSRYEYLYSESPVSNLDVVHTPLTLQADDALYLSIHEAALTDFASMTLLRSGDNVLESDLVPWSDGTRVRAEAPHVSPWRTVQVAETPGDLLTSYLILNLNEPNVLGDVSWLRPSKYVGVWWAMHLRIKTWAAGPNHGATSENVKRYIDFAARHGIDAVLVEGWNTGWEKDREIQGKHFDFTRAYPAFDIDAVTRYASERDVRIIGHHETRAVVANYENQLQQALDFYREHGVDTIKTGYVGARVDDTEWHHGQFMVQHYRKVVEEAAERQMMLVVHEPIKDTGIRRTYPNMMSREGARGQEFNAWSRDGGNPPEHTTILPFTRMLAGPFDFTPGIFDLLFEDARPDNRVNTTLAKQLALYVVLYSPLQMAADLPENYEGHPAFRFIVDVPVDWSDTKVLNAEIGDYISIVRKARNGGDWFLGSITDENERTLDLSLSFLDEGTAYRAEIYADAADADWVSNPLAIDISDQQVTSDSVIQLRLAPGGGQAIRFTPLASPAVQ